MALEGTHHRVLLAYVIEAHSPILLSGQKSLLIRQKTVDGARGLERTYGLLVLHVEELNGMHGGDQQLLLCQLYELVHDKVELELL